MMTPLENTSFATIVPNGLGTCEYASSICSEVAWKSISRPVVPAAIKIQAHIRIKQQFRTVMMRTFEVNSCANGICDFVLCGEEVRAILKGFFRIVKHWIVHVCQ